MASTILSTAIIQNTKGAITSYTDQANGLYETLTSIIGNLTGSDFMGEGSTGYNAYFTTYIKPMLTDNLTGADSLMAGLARLLDDIGNQLIGTTDPQIGEYNQNPASAKE